MSKPVAWGRAALTGAALLVCAGACDSVLGIEEPQDRPTDGGEAGDTPNVAGSKNTGGANGVTPSEGGAAGMPEMPVAGDAGSGGNGGEPPITECEPDEVRCGGAAEKTPEICDETGHWVQNDAESDGDCPILCGAGKCTECEDDATRCTDCLDDGAGGQGSDSSCNPAQLQKCVKGAWSDDGPPCDNYCVAGTCGDPASCVGATSRGVCEGGESCCKSLLVPGGTFKRDYDPEISTDIDAPAEVSPFLLDKFEVTVGRMKQFVAAYPNIHFTEGDGKSAHISDDVGWREDYVLPADSQALTAVLKCVGGTWSDQEENIRVPVNCVPFNVAYAFCIWDGGRLPTNAELNFAAAGGDQQRSYPWGTLEATDEYGQFGTTAPTSVGITPKGNGRWGHADLSGNVSEWVLDYYSADFGEEPCKDCLAASPTASRTFRGGSYQRIAGEQYVAIREGANQPVADIGFRCARDLK